MQISSKSNLVENSAQALAVINRDLKEFDVICGKTPLDDLLEKEDREALGIVSDQEEMEIKCEAVSAALAYLFGPLNGKTPSPLDVLQRLYVLAYTLRPALIEGWSLADIAKCFDSSRQVFSKRLIKQNEKLGTRSRNQKSDTSVSVYREGTKEWHRERKAKERAERRKNYMKAWKAAHAAEQRAYQQQYRAQNRERLNEAKRKKA